MFTNNEKALLTLLLTLFIDSIAHMSCDEIEVPNTPEIQQLFKGESYGLSDADLPKGETADISAMTLCEHFLKKLETPVAVVRVEADDYSGLYVNGVLMEYGSSLDIEAVIKAVSLDANLTALYVEIDDLTTFGYGLPTLLTDLKKVINKWVTNKNTAYVATTTAHGVSKNAI